MDQACRGTTSKVAKPGQQHYKKIMESIASNIAYFKQDPKGKENKIHDTKQRSGHQQIDAYLLYPET